MTKTELFTLIAQWESDLWESEANQWGNSVGECTEVLSRLYAQLQSLN